jgi:hypothetical protein
VSQTNTNINYRTNKNIKKKYLNMFLLKSTLIIGILICFVQSKQICYDSYGCFIDTAPFGGSTQRPFSALPALPDKIGTTFILYNR